MEYSTLEEQEARVLQKPEQSERLSIVYNIVPLPCTKTLLLSLRLVHYRRNLPSLLLVLPANAPCRLFGSMKIPHDPCGNLSSCQVQSAPMKTSLLAHTSSMFCLP